MHAVDIDIKTEASATAGSLPSLSCRWRCCCGKAGPWRSGKGGALHVASAATIPADAAAWLTERHAATAAHSARRGGQRHVAAMERGDQPATASEGPR